MSQQLKDRLSKWGLGIWFGIFLVFLYGPILVMLVLSLQDSSGGSTFPARGLISGYWYSYLGNSASAALRTAAGVSVVLAIIVGLIASALALSLIMAYRRMSRRAARAFLYLILLSLMTPGILLSLGMSLWWKLLGLNVALYPAGLGVQVAWALPFGFLVMLAIFNRYDIAVEEAARDLGASAVQTFTRITLPIIWGGVFGAALFGFTLSWNEFERTLLVSPTATLPLEIYGELTSATLQPNLYALGVITTFGTILLVFLMLIIVALLVRRTARAQAAALAEDSVEAVAAMPALEGA
ncbi:MAG: ABC transporter permease subunit [Solirubrobacterales bacterium]|nr:ABC transporter permease subunit [Solirubrobacterales bacterium]MBV9915370.1 ABC transporter permease subunit [Solirubrobacterales bacterium]